MAPMTPNEETTTISSKTLDLMIERIKIHKELEAVAADLISVQQRTIDYLTRRNKELEAHVNGTHDPE